jgi:ribose/xylose/arabinose/galactoside ABC-type transport system permease subunit
VDKNKLSQESVLLDKVKETLTFSDILRKAIAMGGPIIALALLMTYFSITSPYFATGGNMVNIARQSSINIMLATGQSLVILSGGIDLSVGAIMALAASVSTVAMTYYGINVWFGMLISLAVGSFAGFMNGLVIAKGKVPDFIATLGMMTVARGVALLVTGGLPVPSHRIAHEVKAQIPAELLWLGGGKFFGIPTALLVAVLIVILGWFITRYTRLGRALYAVGGNKEAARVSGIDIDRTKISVYTVSGAFAGIAALVLTGRMNSANALMGEGAELQSIAAVVIGGSNLYGGEGGVGGTLIGALIMGVLNNGLNLIDVSAFWQRVILGSVLIVVVIFDQWRRRRLAVTH